MTPLDRMAAALRAMVSRAKVTDTRVGARTLLQLTGLQGEIKQPVELLLPPGYVGRPAAGADLVIVQVLGQRDHLVALGGDATGVTVTDLKAGEAGIRCGNNWVVVRQDKVEIIAADRIDIKAPKIVLDPLPGSAAGLPSGALWKSGDQVRQVP